MSIDTTTALTPAASQNTPPGRGSTPQNDSPHTWERLDLERLITEGAPSPLWAIDELLQQGTVTYVHGDSGAGKSLLALMASIAVAEGTPIGGRATREGRVLYLDGENPTVEIHKRIATLIKSPHICERIDYRRGVGDALSNGGQAALELLAAAHKPTLIVVDTFRALYEGDENDCGEVTAAIRRLRHFTESTNAAVLVLGHDKKPTQNGGGGFRGSSGLKAAVDCMLELTNTTDGLTIAEGPTGKVRSGNLKLPFIVPPPSHA